MPVYFIRAGDDGPVKIGRAGDAVGRLADLQTAHYAALRIIRETDGGAPEERWFHRHFAALRIRREWFTFDAAMLTDTPPENGDTLIVPLRRCAKSPDVAVIEAIGADAIIAELGVTAAALKKWRQRGIPWRFRAKVKRLAMPRRVDLPADFIEARAA